MHYISIFLLGNRVPDLGYGIVSTRLSHVERQLTTKSANHFTTQHPPVPVISIIDLVPCHQAS